MICFRDTRIVWSVSCIGETWSSTSVESADVVRASLVVFGIDIVAVSLKQHESLYYL